MNRKKRRKITRQIHRLLVNPHLPHELYNSLAHGLDRVSEVSENNATFEFLASKKRIRSVLRDYKIRKKQND